jgi:hypothetical protein
MSDKAELVMFWVMAVPLIAAAAGVVASTCSWPRT